jgi:hypothetical protein
MNRAAYLRYHNNACYSIRRNKLIPIAAAYADRQHVSVEKWNKLFLRKMQELAYENGLCDWGH